MSSTPEPIHTGEDIRKTLRLLVKATIVLYVVMASLLLIGWITSSSQRNDLKDQGTETKVSLDILYDSSCSLREDLQRRVDSSNEFLIEHPDGIPGISAESIQKGIDGQERTIKALSKLECTPEGPDPEPPTESSDG